jgi:hypothetical protein
MIVKREDIIAYAFPSETLAGKFDTYCSECYESKIKKEWGEDETAYLDSKSCITLENLPKEPMLLFCDECGGIIYETHEEKKKPKKRKKKAKARKAKVSGGAGLGAGSTEEKK